MPGSFCKTLQGIQALNCNYAGFHCMIGILCCYKNLLLWVGGWFLVSRRPIVILIYKSCHNNFRVSERTAKILNINPSLYIVCLTYLLARDQKWRKQRWRKEAMNQNKSVRNSSIPCDSLFLFMSHENSTNCKPYQHFGKLSALHSITPRPTAVVNKQSYITYILENQ